MIKELPFRSDWNFFPDAKTTLFSTWLLYLYFLHKIPHDLSLFFSVEMMSDLDQLLFLCCRLPRPLYMLRIFWAYKYKLALQHCSPIHQYTQFYWCLIWKQRSNLLTQKLEMRYKVHLLPCISGVYDIYSRTSALTFNKNAIEGVTRSVFTNCSFAYLNLSRLAITHGEKKVNLNG